MPYYQRISPLQRRAEQVVSDLIYDIGGTPGGLVWWAGLYPYKYGGLSNSQTAIKKRWTAWLLDSFFPLKFKMMLVKACVLPTGEPCPWNRELATWVLENLYSGSIERFYADWLAVKDTIQ